MQPLTILYIGTNAAISATVVRLLNSRDGWTGIGVCNEAEIAKLCIKKTFDVALFGSGIDEKTEASIRLLLMKTHPDIKLIRHYGGGSGLLYNEIMAAMLMH